MPNRGPTLVLDELARAIKERQVMLFAGAGLSMAVGLPSWGELIAQMGEDLEIDPQEFIALDRSYQTLAEYYRLKRGSIGPLRSWMDRNWSVSENKVSQSRLHELIVALDFPIIYTTNYDANLEVAFRLHQRDFVKVTNARDVANVREGVAQIVKFHGDFDDDRSLVLAESDYFRTAELRLAPRHQVPRRLARPHDPFRRIQHVGPEHPAPALPPLADLAEIGKRT
jgi:NAD-dependent SIR2 family protein deacetylase